MIRSVEEVFKSTSYKASQAYSTSSMGSQVKDEEVISSPMEKPCVKVPIHETEKEEDSLNLKGICEREVKTETVSVEDFVKSVAILQKIDEEVRKEGSSLCAKLIEALQNERERHSEEVLYLREQLEFANPFRDKVMPYFIGIIEAHKKLKESVSLESFKNTSLDNKLQEESHNPTELESRYEEVKSTLEARESQLERQHDSLVEILKENNQLYDKYKREQEKNIELQNKLLELPQGVSKDSRMPPSGYSFKDNFASATKQSNFLPQQYTNLSFPPEYFSAMPENAKFPSLSYFRALESTIEEIKRTCNDLSKDQNV